MAEHADKGKSDVVDEDERPRAQRQVNWRRVKNQAAGLIAGIVRWVGLIFALILVLHVIFVVGSANPGNSIVAFVRDWADHLSMGFKDLFEPADEKLRVLVNYGIAAVFWLVVSSIVTRIIRRVGGTSV